MRQQLLDAEKEESAHPGRPDKNPRQHVADEIEANYKKAQDHLHDAQLDGLASLREAFAQRDYETLYCDSLIAKGVDAGKAEELTQQRSEWVTGRYDKWYDKYLDYQKLRLMEKKLEAQRARQEAEENHKLQVDLQEQRRGTQNARAFRNEIALSTIWLAVGLYGIYNGAKTSGRTDVFIKYTRDGAHSDVRKRFVQFTGVTGWVIGAIVDAIFELLWIILNSLVHSDVQELARTLIVALQLLITFAGPFVLSVVISMYIPGIAKQMKEENMLLPYSGWCMLLLLSLALGLLSGGFGGLLFAMIAREPIIPKDFEKYLACVVAIGLGGLVYVLEGVNAACATLKATLICVPAETSESEAETEPNGNEGHDSKPEETSEANAGHKPKPESPKATAGHESKPESPKPKAAQ